MIHSLPHLCTIYKRTKKQKITYTGGTGTPTIGQTITGGTSHKTAVVDKVATGYVVVRTLTGNFTPTETVTTATFSGTVATQVDYQNSSGEYEYYWAIDQANVRCKFYRSPGRVIVLVQGANVNRPLKCALPTTITITALTAIDYKITTTETLFVGSYTIEVFYPWQGMSTRVDHFETELKLVVA